MRRCASAYALPVSARIIEAAMVLSFLLETFLLGIKNLHLHKLRSLLTTLGIILGVFAVIIMVAIGEGATRHSRWDRARG